MFERYRDVIYQGRSDHPITITFVNKRDGTIRYRLDLTGEGGNSHLIIDNVRGDIDLWVDSHCSNDRVFIHGISINFEPGARMMKYVYDLLLKYSYHIDRHLPFFWMKLDALDNFFEELYHDMLDDVIPN